MDLEKISPLIDIASALAVIVTLVFLAWQIRQNTRALRAGSMQAADESFVAINLAVAASEEQAMIFLTCSQNYEAASEADKVRFGFTCMSVFRIFESIFVQYKMGVGEKRLWQGERRSMIALLAMPGIRAWWHDNLFSYSEDFRTMVEAEIARQDPAKS